MDIYRPYKDYMMTGSYQRKPISILRTSEVYCDTYITHIVILVTYTLKFVVFDEMVEIEVTRKHSALRSAEQPLLYDFIRSRLKKQTVLVFKNSSSMLPALPL